ncbi:uncharacterized protein LOC126886060 [Diabrotica virgifera virgifera]|uniref:Tc1-like transposase DDE domain-containing protein n=1 Tax=Diabrotica virgifera virgifera TaxID=50390 RepID=A0ABM5KFB2_DIAVI|nr:uncharacterized protein LOC126886060 [Diabrotica virgifera virgifera]
MEFKSKLNGKVLSGQSREIIANVMHFMQQEARDNVPLIDLKQVQKRVVRATGVSLSAIQAISNEMKCIQDGTASTFSTPNKKRNKSALKSNLDECDKGVLRRFIINFCTTEKQVPTLRRIHRKFSTEYNYNGSHESLRKAMKDIGFRWRKTKTNKKLLMEKPQIQQLRRNFLRDIKKYREDKRPIIYMDETYIHSSHTHSKSWSDHSNEGLRAPISKGQRLIIVHAGGENGFVKNAYLKFKSNTKTGDYHSEMNYENYKKWLQEMLIPNLPPRSVLVVDNAPYHNVQAEKCPTMSSTKSVMKDWLIKRNPPFSEDMLKVDLYSIVQSHKPRFKVHEIDRILGNSGHSVLRLPPYHPDLNPIELVWAALKKYVADKNVDFKFSDVDRFCDEFFETFSNEEWKKRCEHAKSFEKFFREKEPVLDVVFDKIIINLDEDSSSDFSDDNSESDSDFLGVEPL